MRTRRVMLVAALTAFGGLCVGVSILVTGNKPERTAPPAVSASSDAAPQVASPKGGSGSPWGENYFPNVPLVTHEGKEVRFFDDLIKDKVVMINFIYTSCPDTCPLETARLAQVEKILGDRVGHDVFMYSISIDPEHDTPEVLKAYAKRYQAGPGWWFLTGKEADITELRKKLGLYIKEIQDGSNNHNLSLIIGNQATGRWMKRSPFENPHVLATHVGSWLHNWKLPNKDAKDFARAPKLRSISDGERLFRTRCAACHTLGGEVVGGAVATDVAGMGPDLMGVTKRREAKWLARWIAEPDKMLEEKDPIAMELYSQYNDVPMPNMRLNEIDVSALIDFIATESSRLAEKRGPRRSAGLAREAGQRRSPRPAREVDQEPVPDGLIIKDAWIREAHPEAKVNAGYMTLHNAGSEDMVLVGVKSQAHDKAELHEMVMTEGMMNMRRITSLSIPAGGETRLRPGAKHLMLIGPRKPLSRGQKVSITFVFQSGKEQTVTVPVMIVEASRSPRL
ncbi:MAG: copper chaperone PCu(A)C [Deltaproteobacteria bacterium]|nr:copper chaperone PCu(A)C [Deltaproteobacteria bacterium]